VRTQCASSVREAEAASAVLDRADSPHDFAARGELGHLLLAELNVLVSVGELGAERVVAAAFVLVGTFAPSYLGRFAP
jgi:hypothetical protein